MGRGPASPTLTVDWLDAAVRLLEMRFTVEVDDPILPLGRHTGEQVCLVPAPQPGNRDLPVAASGPRLVQGCLFDAKSSAPRGLLVRVRSLVVAFLDAGGLWLLVE